MNLQDLDLLGSPHLEGRWIGGNVDLDLLSLSLKDMQESWEGLRGRQASKVNNGGREREIRAREVLSPLGRKGGFYMPAHEKIRCRKLGADYPAPEGADYPGAGLSDPSLPNNPPK